MGTVRKSEAYRDAIRVFGAPHQILKLREELGELQTAMAQYEQGRVWIDAVIDELADVIITSGQARLILGPDLVDAAIDRKIARLMETIAAERASRKDK